MADYSDNNNGTKLSKSLSSARIDGYSPSMKLVLNILESSGPLTQKEIIEVTHLPPRTARYALNRLKDEEILDVREYFQDARQNLYKVKG